MSEEIEKWLEENGAMYYALTFYHVQTPRYLEETDVENMTLFESRNAAINDYLGLKDSLIRDHLFENKPLKISTVAIVPVLDISECINGKDLIAAVNANIYKAHGINGQVLDSDVDEEAYDFIDKSAKNIIDKLVNDLSVKTKQFMQCHFLVHAMGVLEMQDFALLKSQKDKIK